jgi:hypothetical protein
MVSSHTSNFISEYQSIFLIVLLLLIVAVVELLRLVNRFKSSNTTSASMLKITPSLNSEKSPESTAELMNVFHGLCSIQSRASRILGKTHFISLEVGASKIDGIQYQIYADKKLILAIQKHVTAHAPDAIVTLSEHVDRLESSNIETDLINIKLTRHYAFPLKRHTYLEGDEQIALQLVMTPFYSRSTDRIHSKIHNQGHAVLENKMIRFIMARPFWVWLITFIYWAIARDAKATLSVFIILVIVSLFVRREEPNLSDAQKLQFESILQKLGQPLFRADFRIAVTAGNPRRVELEKGLLSTLSQFNDHGFQSFKTSSYPLLSKFSLYKYLNRLPSLIGRNSNILSATEIASIYHYPFGIIATEGMVRSHSRVLPANLAMKNNQFDIVLGKNAHQGDITPIGLTTEERERHVFVIGGTGNGKTTMLQYAIVQDIQNGKGIAVIDPHGDMAELLLHHIPTNRINDLVYFNPDDLAHPVGLNLLELTPGLTGEDLMREKDLVTESVVSIFRKIFSDDDTGGHRIEYVLRNAIQTALTTTDPTLFTVYDLINDPAYRKKVLANVDDDNLKNFWKNELGRAGDMQKVKMAAGITAKIGRFLFSASAKQILEQPRSTVNFDEILDGKILICNLSKGLIGEDTSELFGIAILAKIQLATLRRARVKQSERKPFYVYVDEFQNFATPSFVQMLSEARKYKLYLTMAEQTSSQQEDQNMVNVILANVGTVICFRSGNPADEKLMLPLFTPYIAEGEIAHLPSFNFYMWVSVSDSQEPISGETVLIIGEEHSNNYSKVIESSRKLYAIKLQPKVQKVTDVPTKETKAVKRPGDA